ncbi:MAG: hypothetical protein JWN70_4458 [Planctomycetaceae bacterium]|nr:hypothetical protein [Planctomycetaceae bacterium]
MGHDSPIENRARNVPDDSHLQTDSTSGPIACPTPPDAPIEIELPLESPEAFRSNVDHEIARARSFTENFFLKAAIVSVAASPVVVFMAFFTQPNAHEAISQIYERWLTVLGPLLGAAFGFGAVKRGDR